jgi:hypothetical protein
MPGFAFLSSFVATQEPAQLACFDEIIREFLVQYLSPGKFGIPYRLYRIPGRFLDFTFRFEKSHFEEQMWTKFNLARARIRINTHCPYPARPGKANYS